jgi:hypothetical protein
MLRSVIGHVKVSIDLSIPSMPARLQAPDPSLLSCLAGRSVDLTAFQSSPRAGPQIPATELRCANLHNLATGVGS